MANEFNNLVMSFETLIETNLAATVGANGIHFDGVDFDSTGVTVWIVPRVLVSAGGMSRASIQNDFVTLQVIIHTKQGAGQQDTLKVRQVADVLRSLLHQSHFSIQATSGGTVVGRCVTEEMEVIRDTPGGSTESVLAVSVPARVVNQT
jgi:hypothetical protein